MNNILIKPYELSIWDIVYTHNLETDINVPLSELSYKEQKIAVIGSDSLKAPNMAYDVVFHKNKNGEKTLTFSMKYKYFDHNTGKIEENPFVPYLINERKVKLYYEEEWYDFIIKEIEENSEEYSWNYTAQDAFVLELSKNGYDITFSNELNNNLGTAQQLAERTLENTDWEVIDLDIGEPIINEPTYQATALANLHVKRMDDNTDVEIPAGTNLLIFYSFVANKNGKFLQFIKAEDDPTNYNIDSHYNITALNYRFDTDVVFNTIIESSGSSTGTTYYYIDDLHGNHLIEYGYIYPDYEVYRTVYQQLVSHDPVMDRIVDEYEYDGRNEKVKVYHYADSLYTTSNVITTFITNGDHFNTYEDGSLQGWNTYTVGSNAKIELSTYPHISPANPVVDVNKIQQLEGFLQVRFKNGSGSASAIFNSGIQNNQALIQRISKGDKFVFRYRIGKTTSEHAQPNKLSNGAEIEAKVAFYEEIEETVEGVKRYVNKPTTTILHFHNTQQTPARVLNNVITGGSISQDRKSYLLSGVSQEPSSKFLYNDTESNVNYFWDGSRYIQYSNSANFLNYYYLTAEAVANITPKQLQDPDIKIGIFIYPTNSNDENYYYFSDVQLTRYYPSNIPVAVNSDEMYPLTIGNIPTAQVLATDYFYVAPNPEDDKNQVTLYLSLKDLTDAMGWPENSVIPIYNRGSIVFLDSNEDIYRVRREKLKKIYDQFHVRGYALNKVSSIEASHSNCFDILQTIAENFECWIDIYVEHNPDGSIFYDDENHAIKTIFLERFCGKENFAGFKYGINLDTITRTIDSNEIVTKLIVNDSQTDLVDSGVVTISGAESNFNKESYIFNFEYFINHDLLPRQSFTEELSDFNNQINLYNTVLQGLQKQERELSNSLVKIGANRNIYSEMLSSARKRLNESLDEFETATDYTYTEFQQLTDEEEKSELLKIDKVTDIIGKIYNCYAVDNSYRGLYANTDTEYAEIYRELYGMKNHYVKISCIPGSTNIVHIELDDYIIPFEFTLLGNTYKSSLSQKSFDIEVTSFNDLTISNIKYNTDNKTGYKLKKDSEGAIITSISVNANAVETYTLFANTPVDGIKTQIDDIIKEKKELIKTFSIKYSRFILEGTWSSQEYLSDELYYLDALLAGKIAAFPKVTYNINVADVSGIQEYAGYAFDVGDRTYIEDTEFFGWIYKGDIKTPAREEIIVSEIEKHLDDPSQNSITVQNYKDHFEDLFQRLQATVQTVEYNETTYPKTSSILDEQKKINQELLLASLSRVAGLQRPLTTDGSIVINGDSITITNLLNRSNVVKMSSEGISISSDGGKTWSAAITGEGINIGNVISDFINTKKIWIGNKENPSYRWDSNGLSAFKLTSDEKYDFKQFVRFDQYGLYGIDLNSALNHRSDYDYVATSLDDVKQDANFAVTWDGFFIKNKYPEGGRVEITSDNDFRVLNTVNGNENEKIKIGALEWNTQDGSTTTDPSQGVGAPTLYGLRIQNNTGQTVMQTGDDGNLSITNTMRVGAINAEGSATGQPHIIIDGEQARIQTSNYQDGAGYGWMIDKNGDAVFNNITARGAIKTAVFEYAEIQAVGGIYLFRPSSTIRSARISGNDLILEVEKPALFEKLSTQEYSWCKISNYTSDGSEPDVDELDILANNGLTHVYRVSNVDIAKKEVTLSGAAAPNAFIDAIRNGRSNEKVCEELQGGALVDMGRLDGTTNYGIGINSSDNTVNLPRRAISLFETEINPNESVKVGYNYQAILGTLPILQYEGAGAIVNSLYNDYLVDTQGIYTNNMYIGDKDQYIAFYTDKSNTPQKHLRVNVKEIWFEANAGQSDFIFLSNTDYGKSVTINNYFTTEWRQIIGTKFGVTNDGTLYAGEAHIDGYIDAKSFIARDINGNMRAKVDINGLTVYDEDGTDIANFNDNTRIGQEDYGHINISSQGIYLYQNKTRKISDFTGNGLTVYDSDGIDIANFNTTTRIGQEDNGHINITTLGMYLYTNATNKVADFDKYGIYLYYDDTNHRTKAVIGNGLVLYNNDTNHTVLASIGASGALFTSDSGKDKINLGTGNITFTKNSINVGGFRYSSYKDNNNLYGLVIDLNRATTTAKPAFAGITADDSDDINYFKLIYLQDNASISGYTSGALNAGCDLDMNNNTIIDGQFAGINVHNGLSGSNRKSLFTVATNGTISFWGDSNVHFYNNINTHSWAIYSGDIHSGTIYSGNIYSSGSLYPGGNTSKYIGYNSNGSIIINSPLMVNTSTHVTNATLAVNGSIYLLESGKSYSTSIYAGAYENTHNIYYNANYSSDSYHSFYVGGSGIVYILGTVMNVNVPLHVSTIDRSLTVEGNLTTTGDLNTNAIDCTDIDAADITCYKVSSSGAVTCGSYFNSTYTYNHPGGAQGSTVAANTIYAAANGNFIKGSSGSSRKYKHSIQPITDDLLDPHRLYNIPVIQYVYNEEYLSNKKDCRYLKTLPGFIAEDIYEIYPMAADVLEEGDLIGWNEHYIIPPMLKLIQEQHEEIEQLKKEIAQLKK